MIRNTLRALVSYVITLPGILLLVGLLTNAEASWWLICAVALVFTCAMFLLHGGRKTPVRRRDRRGGAGDAAGGYYAGSSGDGGDLGSDGGWFGGWFDGGGGDGGGGDGGGNGGGD